MNDTEYHALVESLDAVLDAGGADENNSLALLAEILGELVEAYESARHPMPDDATLM